MNRHVEAGGTGWQWNGSSDKPTLAPSLLAHISDIKKCRSFITDGRIRFLSDCWHKLAGQTVEIPDRINDE